MGSLDHWHPVICSKALRRQPVGVRLNGTDIVLFRGEEGRIGALADSCPHRRMRLSLGKVVNQRLQCSYHGWSFNHCGAGESPGTPKLHATARRFDAVERHGAIWVKSHESEPVFPEFAVDGHYQVCTLRHQVKAPLELVVDNFCEIEHTPTTHALFGYPLDRMNEVDVRFEPTDTTVRVINVGPSKPLSPFIRLMLGIRKGYKFHDDWTTHFSPIYSIYDHWWADPDTREEAAIRWRLYIFFTPMDEDETAIVTFAFTKSRYPGSAGGVRLVRWPVIKLLDHEIDLDVRILESLADKRADLEGMKLSRFDRVLGLNRERIQRIYHGRSATEDTRAPDEQSAVKPAIFKRAA